MGMMLGCSSCAAVRASRWKRSTNSASNARVNGSTLTATSRSRWRSLARNTSAIPPRPSSSNTSYSVLSASRTWPSSATAPVASDRTGVVAVRSRPHEGQNLEVSLISLPQREQNMGASYLGRGGSQWHSACHAYRRRHHRSVHGTNHAQCNGVPLTTPQRPGDVVVPYHTIAFSQQKLRAALRRSSGQEPALTYGFVVHSRRQQERPTLGLITLSGESMALNRRLLGALEGLPLWLFGHARITLDQGITMEGVQEEKAEDAPLTALLMHIATFDVTAVAQSLVQVEAAIRADTLVQPLIVLTSSRPASWPW